MDEMAKTLLDDICQMLVDAKLSIETQLMICLVSNSIKDFEPDFDKVVNDNWITNLHASRNSSKIVHSTM